MSRVTYRNVAVEALKVRDRVLRMPNPTPEVLRSLARTLELAADLATDPVQTRQLRAMSVDALADANKKQSPNVPTKGKKR